MSSIGFCSVLVPHKNRDQLIIKVCDDGCGSKRELVGKIPGTYSRSSQRISDEIQSADCR
jgi:hypothetical protein